MKKNLFISFIIALIYFTTSLVYFFGGFAHLMSVPFLRQLEFILILPAVLVFGAGFSSGTKSAIAAAIVIFFILWAMAFAFVLLFRFIRKKLKVS